MSQTDPILPRYFLSRVRISDDMSDVTTRVIVSARHGLDFKDAAGDTNEGIPFCRTAYSSLKLDNIIFHDQKIPETFRARTARNFTK